MNIDATLKHVSRLISDLTYRLKPIIIELAASNQRVSKRVELSDLTMLDIVHYFNKITGPTKTPEVGYDTNEVNCVPHYDPGLFSLSILSTCDGLQLKDQQQNKWIDGPNNFLDDQTNIGVIWLGEAASILSENRFKSGIHRVVYSRVPYQARLTIWQEVCTEGQIKQLFEKDNNAQRLFSGAKVMLANQPNSKPMSVLPGGETPYAFMGRVKSQRSLSMSKFATPYISVHPKSVYRTNTGPSFPTNNKNHFEY